LYSVFCIKLGQAHQYNENGKATLTFRMGWLCQDYL